MEMICVVRNTHQDKNMGRRMQEREGMGNLSITWKAQIATCLHEGHSSGLSNLKSDSLKLETLKNSRKNKRKYLRRIK